MAANPEVQRLAQEEIANVLGAKGHQSQVQTAVVTDEGDTRDINTIPLPVRLPGFGDRPQLPYLEAVFKEVMRFNPGLSMGKSPNPVFGAELFLDQLEIRSARDPSTCRWLEVLSFIYRRGDDDVMCHSCFGSGVTVKGYTSEITPLSPLLLRSE